MDSYNQEPTTQVRGPLLLKALKGAPFESFKHLAKDAAWLESQTNAEELLQKMDTPDHFGEDREEHLFPHTQPDHIPHEEVQTRRLARIFRQVGSSTSKGQRTSCRSTRTLPRLNLALSSPGFGRTSPSSRLVSSVLITARPPML